MPKTTSRTHAPKQNIPAPAPKQNIYAPSATVQVPSAPSMFDTMKQGFLFGVGSSIAHNIFNNKNNDEVVNKKEPQIETKLESEKIYELYTNCLANNNNNNNTDCSRILEQANSK